MTFTRAQLNLTKQRQELVSDSAAYSFLVMRTLTARKMIAVRRNKRANLIQRAWMDDLRYS